LYHNNPRQHVTTTLLDLLMLPICDRTSLIDTFIILHAGFVTAVYKTIGPHFGAQFLERLVMEFDKFYGLQKNVESSSKEASNLITMLSNMYTFQMVGSNIVFDYIRLLLSELSELNTELLLKLIRSKFHYCYCTSQPI
jgi:nucleolar MIF4G domain-containing protein 1